MTEFVQLSAVDQKQLYFWVLRCYLQKTIRQRSQISIRWTLKPFNTITVVKGPFAHKKSKEQFKLVTYTARLAVRSSIFMGCLGRISMSYTPFDRLQFFKLYGAFTRVICITFLPSIKVIKSNQ